MPRIARYALWPALVVVTLGVTTLLLATGHEVAAVTALPLAAGTLLFGLELVLPAVPRASALHDPQAGHDVVHVILSQGMGNELGRLALLWTSATLAGLVGPRAGLELWPTQAPYAAQALAVVFLADGLEYARHRVAHQWDGLWRYHALHHSLDRLNILKSGRGHFTDMVIRQLAVFGPLAALGVPFEILVWYPAAVTVLGPLGHANIDLPVPAFLHWVFATPQVHRMHHASVLEQSMSNYANVFPVWDILFGTFRNPAREVPASFGIDGDTLPQTLWGQLAAPFAWSRYSGRADRSA